MDIPNSSTFRDSRMTEEHMQIDWEFIDKLADFLKEKFIYLDKEKRSAHSDTAKYIVDVECRRVFEVKEIKTSEFL